MIQAPKKLKVLPLISLNYVYPFYSDSPAVVASLAQFNYHCTLKNICFWQTNEWAKENESLTFNSQQLMNP